MKGFTAFIACMLLAIGCQHPSTVAPAGPHTRPAVVRESGPVELKSLQDPPVRSRKEVFDARVYGWKDVDYIPYDLNRDDKSEYFLFDMHHAHTASFVLIDSKGETMLRPTLEQLSETSESGDQARDDGYICCDQLLVLQSTHEGYFDILAIYTDLCATPMQTWELWVRKDGYYQCQPFRNELIFGGCVRPEIHIRGTQDDYHGLSVPKIRAFWSCLMVELPEPVGQAQPQRAQACPRAASNAPTWR